MSARLVFSTCALVLLAGYSAAWARQPGPDDTTITAPSERTAAAGSPDATGTEIGAGSGGRFTVGASAVYTSAFVWRGFQVSDGACLQPTAWVAFGPVTVTSWLNVDRPAPGRSRVTEHDLTIDYAIEWRRLSASVGWTSYYFATGEDGKHTNEVFASVGFGGFLNPSLQVFHDWQQGGGTYAAVTVSHEFAVADGRATLTPSVAVGYNRHQWTGTTGWSDAVFGLSLGVPVPASRIAVRPFLSFSMGRRAAGLPHVLFGGLSVDLE